MATKLIKNLDNKVWTKFAGYCKAKGITIGENLSNILKDYLEDRLK